MKYVAVLACSLAVFCPSLVMADGSARLKLSATIPPRPCAYPDRCDSTAGKAVPAAATRAVVTPQSISYVGSPPTVEKKDDLLIVEF